MKNLLPYLSAIILAITTIAGFVRFQVQAETTKAKVEELKTETKAKIEKIESDIKEIANEGDKEIKELKDNGKDLEKAIEVNKTQQDAIAKDVQQVSQKTDQIIGMLLEMKPKKK